MLNPRQRAVAIGLGVVLLGWSGAWLGSRIALSTRMTAEKVEAFVASVDLNRLSPEARRQAIRELARRLNALSIEERRRFRLERRWQGWFEQMTEEERGEFLDLTLPTGFKQMLASFEKMPEQNRRVAVSEAVKQLRQAQQALEAEGQLSEPEGTNAPAVLSEELQQKVVKLGLQSFYGESTAQTKAELAPLLEEIQRMMETGRLFRGRRPHE